VRGAAVISVLLELSAHGLQTRPAVQLDPVVNRSVVSPDIHSDGRVTFRLYAPASDDVLVVGEWIGVPRETRLTKDERGVWSGVVGPLKPDLYCYWLRVDGVYVTDPRASLECGDFSAVLVSGLGTAFMENRPVPHGEIRRVWYQSSTYSQQGRMHIYTPPGYESGKGTYPVLYLLPGSVSPDSAWSAEGQGRADFILDNLLADNAAVPMLVVMPFIPRPPNRQRFIDDLLQDIVPYVERHYRVRPESNARAVAGFSIGGYETINLLTQRTDRFAYFGVWSAPVQADTAREFAKTSGAFLADAARVNKMVKLLWFRMGDEDMGVPHVRALSAILTANGITHDLKFIPGAHRWDVWRRNLHEFAPRLFR
jgi:enterochelin esterase family protein